MLPLTELSRAWKACDSSLIGAAINKCVDTIKTIANLRSSLKAGYQGSDVAEWLFNVDHIEVTHGIQYEGKDLRSLSPGTKGIVLIILYLAVDRSDTRPLIVDQPDENLDNQSTFEVLRKYFRDTKKRRQIIVITHNPNLVVNTDAEQIIVAKSETRANGLPHIRYSLGGIEALKADGPLDCSIREAVCKILEGGREAFKMREKRYGESPTG
jgi:energy-coupling factor transporter ATP-binding protein EcfA2